MTQPSRDLRPSVLLVALLVLSILIGTVGTAVGIYGLSLATDAGDRVDAVIEARNNSRKIACESDNDGAERINALNDGFQDTLRIIAAPGDRSPEDQAAVDALLADQLAKYEALKAPIRKCDPASLEAYYQDKDVKQ